MRIIRASEIGTYQYCQRAWWYDRQGIKRQNQAELADGSLLHEQHGRAVVANSCLRLAAFGFLLAAILLLAAALAASCA